MNPISWFRDRVWRSEKQWFVIREVFHFMGGIGIGLLTHLFEGWWWTWILFGILAGGIIVKEIFEDRVSQGRWKTVGDCSAWVLGFWVAAWPKGLQ